MTILLTLHIHAESGADLPYDIRIRLAELAAPDALLSLALVHSSFLLPCRQLIFRSLFSSIGPSNERVVNIAEVLAQDSLGPAVRKATLSFVVGRDTSFSAAHILDDWLRERDAAFATVLEACSQLNVARIRLMWDNPYSTIAMDSQLPRSNLIKSAKALAQCPHVRTLHLNFGHPNLPYKWHIITRWAAAYVRTITTPNLQEITALGLANIAMGDYVLRQPTEALLPVFQGLCTAAPRLKILQLDNLRISTASLALLVPTTCTSFELLDNDRFHRFRDIMAALSDKPNLANIRLVGNETSFNSPATIAIDDAAVFRSLRTCSFENPSRNFESWSKDLAGFIDHFVRSNASFPSLRKMAVVGSTLHANGMLPMLLLSCCHQPSHFPVLEFLEKKGLMQGHREGYVLLCSAAWRAKDRFKRKNHPIEVVPLEEASKEYKQFFKALQVTR